MDGIREIRVVIATGAFKPRNEPIKKKTENVTRHSFLGIGQNVIFFKKLNKMLLWASFGWDIIQNKTPNKCADDKIPNKIVFILNTCLIFHGSVDLMQSKPTINFCFLHLAPNPITWKIQTRHRVGSPVVCLVYFYDGYVSYYCTDGASCVGLHWSYRRRTRALWGKQRGSVSQWGNTLNRWYIIKHAWETKNFSAVPLSLNSSLVVTTNSAPDRTRWNPSRWFTRQDAAAHTLTPYKCAHALEVGGGGRCKEDPGSRNKSCWLALSSGCWDNPEGRRGWLQCYEKPWNLRWAVWCRYNLVNGFPHHAHPQTKVNTTEAVNVWEHMALDRLPIQKICHGRVWYVMTWYWRAYTLFWTKTRWEENNCKYASSVVDFPSKNEVNEPSEAGGSSHCL